MSIIHISYMGMTHFSLKAAVVGKLYRSAVAPRPYSESLANLIASTLFSFSIRVKKPFCDHGRKSCRVVSGK